MPLIISMDTSGSMAKYKEGMILTLLTLNTERSQFPQGQSKPIRSRQFLTTT